MPTADAHHVHSGTASRLGWMICLLLVIALTVTAWFAWRQGTEALARSAARDPALASTEPVEEQGGELAALQNTIRELEAVRHGLQALLQADPCAIPEQSHGLSFVPPAPEPTAAPAPAQPEQPEQPVQPGQSGESGRSTDIPAPAETKKFRAGNDEIEAATTLILSEIGTGTGFFVAPGIVATNRHVVEGSPQVLLLNKALGGLIKGRVIALSQEEERDYALIRIETGSRPLPEPLPLCGGAKKTDKVGSWGFPGAVSSADPQFQALMRGDLHAVPEEVYSEGVVNVVYETAPPMIMHTATTSHGNSGGPLVNANGCVVGISTMISQDQQSYRQTSIALASGDLAAFLWQHGVSPRYSRGGE